MIKKAITLATVTLLLSIAYTASAAQNVTAGNKSNKFRIDELVLLPHPGKYIKNGAIDITEEQNERIAKEVKTVYVPIFQEKMREAFKLQKKVQQGVLQGKTHEELKMILDSIAKLKREAMDSRVDALNQIKEILTDEQWQRVNELTYQ